jgi:hypothetical protein
MRQQLLSDHYQIDGQNVHSFVYPGRFDDLVSAQTLHTFYLEAFGFEVITLGDDVMHENEQNAGGQQSGNTGNNIKACGQTAQNHETSVSFRAFAVVFTWLLTTEHRSPLHTVIRYLLLVICLSIRTMFDQDAPGHNE